MEERKKEMERVEEGAKSRKIGGRCGKQNTASDATLSPAYRQSRTSSSLKLGEEPNRIRRVVM